MPDDTDRVERSLRRVLRVAALLVPEPRRKAWLKEWTAEVVYALSREPGVGTPLRLGGRSALAFVDALWIRGEEWKMGEWPRQLAIGVRRLWRSPTYTLVAVFTFAVGVGANSTIYSLADWALLKPLPGVSNPDELVSIRMRLTDREGILPLSYPTVRRILDDPVGLASVAAHLSLSVDVSLDGAETAQRYPAQVVTPGFFHTLGVGMQRGREFERREGDPTTIHRSVIVSEKFWVEALGRAPDVLGRTLSVGSGDFEIVGVAAPGFEGTRRTASTALWFPVSATPEVVPRLPPDILTMERGFLFADLVGRLDPAGAPEAVAAGLQRGVPELEQMNARPEVGSSIGLPAGLEERVAEALWVLGGSVVLLLLLTLANLANLLLSRLARRREEILMRRALGASPSDLIRDVMGETVLLALVGGGLAVASTWLSLELMEGTRLVRWLPPVSDVPIDGRVLGFTLGVSLAAALAATAMAGLTLRRLAPAAALSSARSVSNPGRRFRKTLVATQIALSLALLVGAALLVRTVEQMSRIDLGYEPRGVVVFSLNPGAAGLGTDDADALFRDLLPRIRALPGVEATGFTWLAPLEQRRYTEEIVPSTGDGADRAMTIRANMVTPGFFEAMDMEVVRGRTFDDREYLESERPERGDVMVSRSLAEALFPGRDPIGKEIRMSGRQEAAFTIIGVVEDARFAGVREPAEPFLYDPFGNGYQTSSATFVVRTSGAPDAALTSIRGMVRDRAPEVSIQNAGLLRSQVESSMVEERMMMRLGSAFAILAALLAAVGLYGLVSESVQARVREFGIRTALGARSSQVFRLVLRESLVLVTIGTLAGLVLATQVARVLESRLFGIASMEPASFLGATILLGLVAVVASLGPAARSTRIDPARALRAE